MTSRPTTTRRRAVLALTLTAALALPVVHAPAASAGNRGTLLRLLNASRERHGLDAVRLDHDLSQDSRQHTRRMLRENRIFDPPNLQQILVGYPWNDMGAAAVGCASTARLLHEDLMQSDVHRDILLHPDLRWVGIGAIEAAGNNLCGAGSLWVSELFYG